MKETREDIVAKLEERRQRLADMQERGVESLSHYDREIAFGGDDQLALVTSMQLIRNHIAYHTRQLAEMDEKPQQPSLF